MPAPNIISITYRKHQTNQHHYYTLLSAQLTLLGNNIWQ